MEGRGFSIALAIHSLDGFAIAVAMGFLSHSLFSRLISFDPTLQEQRISAYMEIRWLRHTEYAYYFRLVSLDEVS